MVDPAPDDDQVKQIIKTAMSAPDHGRIRPYRFISIRDNARLELSKVFAQATKRRDPNVSPEYLKKQQDKPLRAPLIIVVVACLIESQKIPHIEQMLSAGAAAHNILLASNAMGFGSIWLTGDNAYDSGVCSELGLLENEKIVGFIYLGTEAKRINTREEIDPEDKISSWNGAL